MLLLLRFVFEIVLSFIINRQSFIILLLKFIIFTFH